jgi:hypothetical protein
MTSLFASLRLGTLHGGVCVASIFFGRFEITFFQKVLMEKKCERKRHPNGRIGWVGEARLRISGRILGL